MKQPKIASKILKLLKLAEDQAGTSEGESAARMAHKLMREHAVSVSLGDEQDEDRIQEIYEVGSANWKRSLMWRLAEHCSVYAIRWSKAAQWTGKQWRSNKKNFKLFGKPSNVEICLHLFKVCERQIEKEYQIYRETLPSWYDRGMVKAAANDFRTSAVRGLASKLEDMRKEAQSEDAQGTALVAQERAQAEAWAKDSGKVGKVTQTRMPTTRYNQDGYNAGRRVRLHDAVKGSNKPTRTLDG